MDEEQQKRIEKLEEDVKELRNAVWELQKQAGYPPGMNRGLTPIKRDK